MKLRIIIDFSFLSSFFKKKIEADVSDMKISYADDVLWTVFNEYPKKRILVFNAVQSEFNSLFNNPLFEKCLDHSKITFENNIEKYIIDNDCSFSMFFVYNNQRLSNLAYQKGALCFQWDTYENRINRIINQCHTKIDLGGEPFQGWENVFENVKDVFPTTQITMVDRYLLKDFDVFYENIIPILKLFYVNSKKLDVFVFSMFNDYKEVYINKSDTEEFENMVLDAFRNVGFYMANSCRKWHDRVFYGQYFTVDSTCGFNKNLFRSQSNSIIIIDSILSKFTYKRMIRHKDEINEHYISLNNINGFNFYPEIKRKITIV